MKKQIQLSLLAITIWGSTANASWFINGKEVLSEYPINISTRSIDNGGSLTAKIASTDGVGVIIAGNGLSNTNEVDNSAYNNLVTKYADKAEISGLTIANEVLQQNIDNPGSVSTENISFANQIKVNVEASGLLADGTACDDGNVDTDNDEYHNGVCVGIADGDSCNDGNNKTVGDFYENGICGSNIYFSMPSKSIYYDKTVINYYCGNDYSHLNTSNNYVTFLGDTGRGDGSYTGANNAQNYIAFMCGKDMLNPIEGTLDISIANNWALTNNFTID